jgi:hypothetical protein
MIKHFCDRCGKETASVLLCPSCFSNFFSFLRNPLSVDQPKEKDHSTREVFFKGMQFEVVPNKTECDGCFFYSNNTRCLGEDIRNSTGILCGVERVIFRRIEP